MRKPTKPIAFVAAVALAVTASGAGLYVDKNTINEIIAYSGGK